MYQYILFDLDGTLTDPKQGITGCVQYALRRLGMEAPDADALEPFIGPPLLDSFQEFCGFDEEGISGCRRDAGQAAEGRVSSGGGFE